MRVLIASALALATMANSGFAEVLPKASRLDNRVRIAPYVDGQVYNILVAVTRATTVEFEPGEEIVSIVAGDTAAFDFDAVPGNRVMAIKPTADNVATNVTVYTTQRSYYFRLQEGDTAFYAVRFEYPKRASEDSRRVHARDQNATLYGVSAQIEITPTNIWDNGVYTYFQFAPGSPVPAIFKVRAGQERSVNSVRQSDGLMRVSGVSDQWALRLGDLEVCIVELAGG